MLEVVLSIDNLVVIAVLVGKLPKERQAQAALLIGIYLGFPGCRAWSCCCSIGWIIGLTEPLIFLFGHGISGKVT